ncbi:hypothetical protein ACIHFC_28920 [Streptomyces sp. NPDC052013]|uniref:hypothetical protein n=1 Tax=Streptomyces sp. NPDC052013 TaxID=3365679 RepID=UPI0037D3C19A
MSDETPPEETTGGEDAVPGRFAGGCVAVILVGVLVLVLKATVSAAPYVAYFVAGILATLAVQKVRLWLGGRRGEAGEQPEEAPAPDIAEALRRLVGDDRGVLLTRLRDDLKLPNTKAVKTLLKAAGIPWKAVRTREGNGPAVHRDAIPPAPSPLAADAHAPGCCCRSGDNANSNNSSGELGEKGIRVERTDGGLIIHDLSETHRHCTHKGAS